MNQLKFSLENDQRLELRDELTKSKKKAKKYSSKNDKNVTVNKIYIYYM